MMCGIFFKIFQQNKTKFARGMHETRLGNIELLKLSNGYMVHYVCMLSFLQI